MRAQPLAPADRGPLGRTNRWADAGLVSGEAVELDVRAARIGSRVLALLIDVLAQVVVAVLLAIVLALVAVALPATVVDAALTGAFQTVGLVLVLVGYPVVLERFNHGRTLGKMAVGLRVVRADGGPVGVGQSLARALVGVAVEWPGLVLPLLSWVASVTVMLTDQRGRRLGDLVAGTMVVHTRTAAVWRPIPMAVPSLVGWAYTLDLTRLDDALALAARQYLGRVHQLVEPTRGRLGRALWAQVAAVTSPPPPPGAPASVYLAAVLAERHRRAVHRLGRTRAVTASLWPELTPAAPPFTTPPLAAPPLAAPPTAAAVPTQPAPPVVRPGAPTVTAERPRG